MKYEIRRGKNIKKPLKKEEILRVRDAKGLDEETEYRRDIGVAIEKQMTIIDSTRHTQNTNVISVSSGLRKIRINYVMTFIIQPFIKSGRQSFIYLIRIVFLIYLTDYIGVQSRKRPVF